MNDTPIESDDPLETSSSTASGRAPLSHDAYARIQAAVETEWRGTVRSRVLRRRTASIAGVLAAIALTALTWNVMSRGPVVASVARNESGDLATHSILAWHRSIGVGSELRVGETLTARGAALLTLQGGGSVRVMGGTELVLTGANRVALRSGEIYVDIPPNLTSRATFAVSTERGLIEHLGTQFDVACVDRSIRVRVREGLVRVTSDRDTQKVDAGTELLVSSTGGVGRREISAHDAAWGWTAAMTPDYEIENRKLADFLQWAARESGRQVSWTDEVARLTAERVELHGSVRGLKVDEALDRVLATTSLHLNLSPARIQVSSGG